MFCFSSRRRHTRCALVTGVQTCALPIYLSWEDFAKINLHSPDLPGVQLDVGETRDYPYADAFSHVVGYVGAVSDTEIGDDPLLELPGFRVGKSGVEKVFDERLRGRAGHSQIEVNAYGRAIRELERTDGQPGDGVVPIGRAHA